MTIGGAKTITFTSAAAIDAFLPQGGTPARLTASSINPAAKLSVLAGQVLALRLNVDFSDARITTPGLATLTLVDGDLAGMTVRDVLTLASAVLGGGGLPSDVTLAALTSVLDTINSNFDGGVTDGGHLE